MSKCLELILRCFKRLKAKKYQNQPSVRDNLETPKPQTPDGCKQKKILMLDLDETLIRSTQKLQCKYKVPHNFQIQMKNQKTSQNTLYNVYVRNECLEFIKYMSNYYELGIFTASNQHYADQIIKEIDPLQLVKYKFYKHDCISDNGSFIKDLKILNKEMSQIILIDNIRDSSILQHENTIQIKAFRGNPKDQELAKLTPFLVYLSYAYDVRPVQRKLDQYQKQKQYGQINLKKLEITEVNLGSDLNLVHGKEYSFQDIASQKSKSNILSNSFYLKENDQKDLTLKKEKSDYKVVKKRPGKIRTSSSSKVSVEL